MRVLLVDDHRLFRDGVASLIGAWGHEVVGQAGSGEEAVTMADDLRPELVLLDVAMPGFGGVEAARRVKARHPEMRIVMLTVSEDEDDLFKAIQAGAQGYLLKNLTSCELRLMLEGVERGEAAIGPTTAVRILKHLARGGSERPGHGILTDREVQVLRLVTAGHRNKEIATQLGITENTTKYHLKNILQKLHAQSRGELAARAREQGLITDR